MIQLRVTLAEQLLKRQSMKSGRRALMERGHPVRQMRSMLIRRIGSSFQPLFALYHRPGSELSSVTRDAEAHIVIY
jgi:hypothetical protein